MNPGWHIFKGVDLPHLYPVLCPWWGVPSVALLEPFLGGHLGRGGGWGQRHQWVLEHSPQGSHPRLPLSPFLRNNPVAPDVCIQVLWPSLSPAWSLVAGFLAHRLPKRSRASVLCLRPRPAASGAGLHHRGTRSPLSMVPLTRRVLQAGGESRPSCVPCHEARWPPPQPSPSVPAVMMLEGPLSFAFLNGPTRPHRVSTS